MAEPFGRRDFLTARVRYANYVATGASIGVVCCVLGAFDGYQRSLWVIGAIFFAAVAVFAVRLVTVSRIELIHMGRPGPSVAVDNDPTVH